MFQKSGAGAQKMRGQQIWSADFPCPRDVTTRAIRRATVVRWDQRGDFYRKPQKLGTFLCRMYEVYIYMLYYIYYAISIYIQIDMTYRYHIYQFMWHIKHQTSLNMQFSICRWDLETIHQRSTDPAACVRYMNFYLGPSEKPRVRSH